MAKHKPLTEPTPVEPIFGETVVVDCDLCPVTACDTEPDLSVVTLQHRVDALQAVVANLQSTVSGLVATLDTLLPPKKKLPQDVKVGDVVHFVGGGSVTGAASYYKGMHLAGLVTHVNPATGVVSITALPPGARDQLLAPTNVKYDEAGGELTWHWPEA